MNDQPPISPRRRLQVLLAIPDSERTEAQWDELNELEIMLAPGNRLDTPDRNVRNPAAAPAGRSRQQGPRPPGGSPQPKKPFKRFQKKPPKVNPPS